MRRRENIVPAETGANRYISHLITIEGTGEMQISNQQVDIVQRSARAKDATAEAPVKSVEELAARHGVRMDEVRKFTERAMMAEEDPAREKRIRELTRKINAGSYQIDAEDLVDMAERRAIADRAKDI